jgi:hypothetical protein
MNRGAIVCFGLVALACGWMFFGPTPGKENQVPAVKSAVDSYVRAFANGDGKAACDLLNEAARQAVTGMAARIGATDCPSAMEKTRQIGGSEVRSIARKIRVRKVDVKGSTARVTLRADGQDSIAELEQVGHDWKISSLPKA